MKKLIIILVIVLPFLANAQDYRVIDWKTNVLNVQTVGVDTFVFDAEPIDYNDAGAITREIGNYFIDFVARCFKIIDSDATTITVVDLEHINLAPQSNKIGRVYQSIVDADSIFKSIGGVDISVLDDLSRWKDVARNNELFGRKIKELDGRDTTGIYHTNRELLNSITPEDTTRWATGGLITETDPTVSALVKSIDATDTTYWGRAETDPTISAWAKAATKPTYTYSEVGAQPAGSYATTTQLANQLSQTISNGVTTKAPSEDAVYDALAEKQNTITGAPTYLPIFTGANTFGNSPLMFESNYYIKSFSPIKIQLAAPGFLLKDSHSNYSGFFYVYDSIFGIQKRNYTDDSYIANPYAFSLAAPHNTINVNNLGNTAFGHGSPLTKVHIQAASTQLRLGYDATKITDFTTNSSGHLAINPSGGLTSVIGTLYANIAVSSSTHYAGSSYWNSNFFELGYGQTGNRYSVIDLTGDDTYTDYGLRIIRGNTGPNAISQLLHRGKGGFYLGAQDAASFYFYTKNNTALTIDTLQNVGVGILTPAARIHSQSTTTQLRLGYDATKYTDLSTNSAGTFNITPSGGFTAFSGGISASAFSTFTGQVEMTGLGVNLGASTVLRKNGSDIFTAPITMGACGSAGQVLSSTGPNSAPTWTTPATGSGSGITSIGMQVPTGLTVSPSSLTANGTFTFGLQSGYSIPTTANQTNWSTAYSQRLISVSASYPMYLSLTNNVLTGYLNNTLTNFGGVVPSVGYPYWNGSNFSYQAATTTYTLPTASNSTLGGIQVSSTDGGLAMSGNYLLQKDNVLTARTPVVSDEIAFYDISAAAQGKMTLSTLSSLIGTSGGMVYPGAGIPVSTGSSWGTSKTAPSGAIVGTTDSQALTNKSVNGVTLSTVQSPTRFLRGDGTYERINVVQTLTSAPSITMDIWNGSKAVLALATNSTITITNVPDGGEGSIEVTSSGAYTLAIAGSTGYTTTQKMGTVAAIASSAHTTVFYWRSGTVLYYGYLLNN